MATHNNPHVIVWLGTTGASHTPVTYTGNGELLVGYGPHQFVATPVPSTLASVREEAGDPTVAPWLPGDTPCMVLHRDCATDTGLAMDTDAPVVVVAVAAHHVAANL